MRPSFRIPRFATKFTKTFASKRLLSDFVKSTNNFGDVTGSTSMNAWETIKVLKEKNYSKYAKPSVLLGKAKILEKKRRELMERCKPPIYNDDIQELSPYVLDNVSKSVNLRTSDVAKNSTKNEEAIKSKMDDLKIVPYSQKAGKGLEETKTQNEKSGLEPIPLYLLDALQTPKDLPAHVQIAEDVPKNPNSIKELTDGEVVTHKDESDIKSKMGDINVLQKLESNMLDSSKAERRLQIANFKEESLVVKSKLLLKAPALNPKLDDDLKHSKASEMKNTAVKKFVVDEFGVSKSETEIELLKQLRKEHIEVIPEKISAKSNQEEEKTVVQSSELPLKLHTQRPRKRISVELPHKESKDVETSIDMKSKLYHEDLVSSIKIDDEAHENTPLKKTEHMSETDGARVEVKRKDKHDTSVDSNATKFKPEDRYEIELRFQQVEPSKEVKPRLITVVQQKDEPLQNLKLTGENPKKQESEIREARPNKSKTVLQFHKDKTIPKVNAEDKIDEILTTTVLKKENVSVHGTEELSENNKDKTNETSSNKVNKSNIVPDEQNNNCVVETSSDNLVKNSDDNLRIQTLSKDVLNNSNDSYSKQLISSLEAQKDLYNALDNEKKKISNVIKQENTYIEKFSDSQISEPKEQNSIKNVKSEVVQIIEECSKNENIKVPEVKNELEKLSENTKDFIAPTANKEHGKEIAEHEDQTISLEKTGTKYSISEFDETSTEVSKTIDNIPQTIEQNSGCKETEPEPKVSGNLNEDMKMNFLSSMKPKFNDTKPGSWNKQMTANMTVKEDKTDDNLDSMEMEYKSKETNTSNVENNKDVKRKTQNTQDLTKEFIMKDLDSTSKISVLMQDYKDEKQNAIEDNDLQISEIKTDLKNKKTGDDTLLNENLREDSYIENSDSMKLASEINSLQQDNCVSFDQHEKENVKEKNLTPSINGINADLKIERTSTDALQKVDSEVFKHTKELEGLPVNESNGFDNVQSSKNENHDEIENIGNVKSTKKLDFEDESTEKFRKSIKDMDLKDFIENIPKISMERIEKLSNAVEQTRKAVKKAKAQQLKKYKTSKKPKSEDQTESNLNNLKTKPSIRFSDDGNKKRHKPTTLSKSIVERVMLPPEPKNKDETKNLKYDKKDNLTEEKIPSIKLIAKKSKKKLNKLRNNVKKTKPESLTEGCTDNKINGMNAEYFEKGKEYIGFVEPTSKTEDDKKPETFCTKQTNETSEKSKPKSVYSTDVGNDDTKDINLNDDVLEDEQVTSKSEKPFFVEMSMPKYSHLSAGEKRNVFIKSTLHLKNSMNNDPSIDQKPPSKNCASDAKIFVADVNNESHIRKSKNSMFGTSTFWSRLPFKHKSKQIQVPKPSLDIKKPVNEFEGELEKWKSFSSKKPEDDY